MWGVEGGDAVDLVADEVVQAVGAVGVDEAVTNPLTCANAESSQYNHSVTMLRSAHLSLMSVTTSKADSTPSSSASPFARPAWYASLEKRKT